MSNEIIQTITDNFHQLNPTEAAECLYQISQRMVEDSMELQAVWQDPQAGKVWDIMGRGIDKTVTKAMKHWETL